MELILSKDIYSKEAIMKTVYLFHDRLTAILDSDENSYILKIETFDGVNFDETELIAQLQEQQLRESLNGQFGKLREVIYQKAFSLVE